MYGVLVFQVCVCFVLMCVVCRMCVRGCVHVCTCVCHASVCHASVLCAYL